MRVATTVLFFLACLTIGAFPGKAQAQEEGTRAPVPHNQVVSANPFLILFEWFNGEYERKISPTTTLGVGASRLSLDDGDESYTGLNGFLRYYPQGAALSGFSFGGRLGFHNVSEDDEDGEAFALGVDLGYSWLLGSKRNFYIGLGIGATRLFGGDIDGGRVVIPSIRLINLGFAF
ncbi:MAG: DUF3575 domain-containing protein [Gemmatimonadetes bacterium]|nr:DUF3575 domain-containing protein [Gemmatimonadota bacterium]NNM04916.1 DUF3575 domain-containing protein [Gemmatimonadota bacterium]